MYTYKARLNRVVDGERGEIKKDFRWQRNNCKT